ncbi:NIMA interactive protein [Arthroderma uncinatum]|uniref:NIMA interactive protein n=1 Tax=Arthroderma uncinatum TaxID=74035 RepID=UPI00144AA7ED|nr:NIMA interactive protein [Arthroderma uncinatum]KAF3484168.1 NIMA interactive protein [Arthroderma uncinatum]
MDALNLHTASDYINNLLLARGLLRNGKRIDFAEPEEGSDGSDDTMTQIINLVHDLVTRRDREAEQRENLATTVKSLRKTEAKQALQIERLESKTEDLSRSIALAEGQETAFKTTIRNADTTIRGLKEQMQRTKSSIQQIRSQCATDIRKRDIELQKLKTHLTDRQRGKRDGLGVVTITIQPPPKVNTSNKKTLEGGNNVEAPGYSLKQETTEFLTKLCQSLSDENDALIQLSRNTIQTLKELQGLPDVCDEELEGVVDMEESVDATLSQHELLSKEMDSALEQLRALLTNPSFVPLEEVEIRDSEIARLRDGWEKMETRWQEAVSMMDGWHKRISHGSGSMNLDELRLGMSFTTDSSMQKDAGSTTNVSIDPSMGSDNSGPSSRRVSTEHPARERPKRLFDTQDDRPLQEFSGNDRSRATIFSTENSFDGSVAQSESIQENDEAVPVKKPDADGVRQKRQKLQSNRPDPRQAPRAKPDKAVASKLAKIEQEAQAAEEERKKAQSKKRTSSRREGTAYRPRKRSSLNKEELQSLLRARRLANKGQTRVKP